MAAGIGGQGQLVNPVFCHRAGIPTVMGVGKVVLNIMQNISQPQIRGAALPAGLLQAEHPAGGLVPGGVPIVPAHIGKDQEIRQQAAQLQKKAVAPG